MKISTRLITGFSLLTLLFVLCTGIALNALWHARDGMNDSVNVKMKSLVLALDMRAGVRDMAIAVRNLALLTDPVQMQPEWQRLVTQRETYIQQREQLKKIMAYNVAPAGKAALGRVLSAEDAALSTQMTAGKMGLDNQQQEVTAYLMNSVRPAQKALLGALNELTDIEMKVSRDTVAENSVHTSRVASLLTWLAVLSVMLAAGTCFLTVRVLMRQLGGEPASAQALAAVIASGDLTSSVTLRPGDTSSLMASLDNMQSNLRGLVSQIKDSAALVTAAADEIAQGNT